MESESGLGPQYRALRAEIDARGVLRYLNQLGIRNVGGEALKEFITDLKKLIKYDLQSKISNVELESTEVRGPERLHSASTFCSRTRSRRRDQPVTGCRRQCRRYKENVPMRNVVSAPSLRSNVHILPSRRSCSCTREEKPEQKVEPKAKKGAVSTSSNLIKVPIAQPKKKSDPVSLYHYYLSMWDKYKSNVPGENSWSELRWSIRQKIAGEVQKPVTKGSAPTMKDLEKRRQGWVD